MSVTISGLQIKTLRLPDDPADARGVLSHCRGFHGGSYGLLTNIELTRSQVLAVKRKLREERLVEVRFEVPRDAGKRGGLAIFGERVGRYPMDPCLILNTSRPVDRKQLLQARRATPNGETTDEHR